MSIFSGFLFVIKKLRSKEKNKRVMFLKSYISTVSTIEDVLSLSHKRPCSVSPWIKKAIKEGQKKKQEVLVLRIYFELQ